tara:strand:- start:322 stop:528 length:207 start_codon:yes stop_codon:yes gene_type:complete
VKKINENTKIINSSSLGETETGKQIKTTNVNILLNRVRLDQKKDFKKKLILFFIFLVTLSSLTILAIL